MNHRVHWKERLKNHLICIFCVVVFLFSGCTTIQLAVPANESSTVSAEYDLVVDSDFFSADSPSEYLFFIEQVFSTLLPLVPRDTDLGLGTYYETFGMPIPASTESESFDALISTDQTNSTKRSLLPVFYGLLKQAEEYLSSHGINRDEIAAQYGKLHALTRSDVQIIANLLLRKDVALTFASVAGAEYLPEEGLFVYDELLDPYQSFYDLGWTMEFVGSDMEMSSTFPWGSFMGSCPSTALFFYDAESGVLYNPYGEQCGYTHNIDGLRSEAYGSLIYRSCTFSNSYDIQKQYFVEAFFMLEEGEIVTADTPIYAVQCGSLSSSSAGEYILPEGELTPNQLATITSEFFDDFYHNSDVGGKTTNYALASFFGKPDEINTAFLPLQSDAELEQWCEKYLNLSASDLKVMQAPGTAECGTPYVTLLSGNQKNDLLTLHYYNEMQKQYAVLVLRKTNDGYQFVSNMPEA